jgi:hypothetical protein
VQRELGDLRSFVVHLDFEVGIRARKYTSDFQACFSIPENSLLQIWNV